MCTNIVEHAEIGGSGKGTEGWFSVRRANISYDHPFHADVEHALNIDFVDGSAGTKRVAVELTLDGARNLAQALIAAVQRAESYERGEGEGAAAG